MTLWVREKVRDGRDGRDIAGSVAIYKPQKKFFLILCSKTSQP